MAYKCTLHDIMTEHFGTDWVTKGFLHQIWGTLKPYLLHPTFVQTRWPLEILPFVSDFSLLFNGVGMENLQLQQVVRMLLLYRWSWNGPGITDARVTRLVISITLLE